MPIMSRDDFSVHADECEVVDDGMPISDLPDEVSSLDDLECGCWSGFESIDDVDGF